MSAKGAQKHKDKVVFNAGVKEGRRQMQVVALTYLEERYMDRSIARNGTKAKAILDVAADLAEYLRGLNKAIEEAKQSGK